MLDRHRHRGVLVARQERRRIVVRVEGGGEGCLHRDRRTECVQRGVDWHTEATIVAQSDTQHIVESEDRAARQAGALTAMIKPFNAPHKPGPRPPWDPSPRYRWQPAQGGGFVMALNDHCEVFFLIMVWVGCTVGELPPARGDLFKNLHPPETYGDWDWRLDDP